MPFVRIALKVELPAPAKRLIAETVHGALVSSLGIPIGDRFQIVTTHGNDLIYDEGYMDMERTDGVVFIQIVMALGRTVEQKKALFVALASGLELSCGVAPDNVFVTLVENARENWSFGKGIAQYADSAPPHLSVTQ